MFKIIAIIAVVATAGLLIYASTRPDSFGLQRSASIKAPPEKIFALIDNFHSWAVWSPYEKLDPALQRTFSGAESGKGAVYEWSGNAKAGAGRMEIVESVPSSKIVIKLDFIKPFEGHYLAEFTLESRGESTDITWAMNGQDPYIGKLMGIFINRDQLIGKDFESGLAALKAATEQ